jgi:hypothetical protein
VIPRQAVRREACKVAIAGNPSAAFGNRRVSLFVLTMGVHQEVYVRHQHCSSSPQRLQILRFGCRREVSRLVVDPAPPFPEGHHPKAPCVHARDGCGAPETFPKIILDQAAKWNSSRRGRGLRPPEHVVIELNRSPHKDGHKDA